jgi:hypothetical protein
MSPVRQAKALLTIETPNEGFHSKIRNIYFCAITAATEPLIGLNRFVGAISPPVHWSTLGIAGRAAMARLTSGQVFLACLMLRMAQAIDRESLLKIFDAR